MKLFHIFEKFEDVKTPLWIPLPLEEKLSIFLHEFSTDEVNNSLMGSFMLVMIYYQHDKYFKQVKKHDDYFEVYLNNLIYEKYIGLSKIEAYKTRKECVEKEIFDIHEENTNQLNFITYLYNKSLILCSKYIKGYVGQPIKNDMEDLHISTKK